MWRSEDSPQKLVFSFYHVGPRDRTPVVGYKFSFLLVNLRKYYAQITLYILCSSQGRKGGRKKDKNRKLRKCSFTLLGPGFWPAILPEFLPSTSWAEALGWLEMEGGIASLVQVLEEHRGMTFQLVFFVSAKFMRTKKRLIPPGDKPTNSIRKFSTGSLGHKAHYWTIGALWMRAVG